MNKPAHLTHWRHRQFDNRFFHSRYISMFDVMASVLWFIALCWCSTADISVVVLLIMRVLLTLTGARKQCVVDVFCVIEGTSFCPHLTIITWVFLSSFLGYVNFNQLHGFLNEDTEYKKLSMCFKTIELRNVGKFLSKVNTSDLGTSVVDLHYVTDVAGYNNGD
jgi:hypothetical protein